MGTFDRCLFDHTDLAIIYRRFFAKSSEKCCRREVIFFFLMNRYASFDYSLVTEHFTSAGRSAAGCQHVRAVADFCLELLPV